MVLYIWRGKAISEITRRVIMARIDEIKRGQGRHAFAQGRAPTSAGWPKAVFGVEINLPAAGIKIRAFGISNPIRQRC